MYQYCEIILNGVLCIYKMRIFSAFLLFNWRHNDRRNSKPDSFTAISATKMTVSPTEINRCASVQLLDWNDNELAQFTHRRCKNKLHLITKRPRWRKDLELVAIFRSTVTSFLASCLQFVIRATFLNMWNALLLRGRRYPQQRHHKRRKIFV